MINENGLEYGEGWVENSRKFQDKGIGIKNDETKFQQPITRLKENYSVRKFWYMYD